MYADVKKTIILSLPVSQAVKISKKMTNSEPNQTGLEPGQHIKHGFYIDIFMPCNGCEKYNNCPNRDKFKDHRGEYRCIEEKEFYETTINDIKENFQLDAKDMFQLPQMVMTMLKLKRMARFTADHGETGLAAIS